MDIYFLLCYGDASNRFTIWLDGSYLLLYKGRISIRKERVYNLWHTNWCWESQTYNSSVSMCWSSSSLQSCRSILADIFRLFHEQHTLFSLGAPLALFLRIRISLGLNKDSHKPLHQNPNSSHHNILSYKLLASYSSDCQPYLFNL